MPVRGGGTLTMRKLLPLAGISLVLVGCLRNELGERLGASELYRTAEKAQNLGLLTPAISAECSARLTKMFTTPPKFVGPFSISAETATRKARYNHTLLPNNSADNTVAVVAPVNTFGPFGENHTMSGCLYRLEGDRLVFEAADIFSQRMDVTRRQKSE